MRKTSFLTFLMLAVFTIAGFTRSFAGDLYVQNSTNRAVTSISFTATTVMETFSNIAPGDNKAGALAYTPSDMVTVSFFFASLPPGGATVKIYNSDMHSPDGAFKVQPGLNTFQLNAPLHPGGIIVVFEP